MTPQTGGFSKALGSEKGALAVLSGLFGSIVEANPLTLMDSVYAHGGRQVGFTGARAAHQDQI